MRRLFPLFGFLLYSIFWNTVASAQTDQIDIRNVTIVNAPDVRSWPITTAMTHVWFDGSITRVDFTKKDGPNRWPDATPAGWSGPLEYTLWLFVKNGDSWVGSGFIQFWNGRDGSGSPADPDVPSVYDKHWYYAPRWSPIFGHGPIAKGEQIGFMVTSGNARDNVGPSSVQERSNVVLFAASDNADYTFQTAPPAPPAPVPVPTPPPMPSPVPPPLPSIDYGPLLERILAAQEDLLMATTGIAEVVKDTNAHVQNIDRTLGQTLGAAAKWASKYVVPALAAFIAARKL